MAPRPVNEQNTLLQPDSPASESQKETKGLSSMASLMESRLMAALSSEMQSHHHSSIYYEEGSDQSEFVNCHDRNRMVKWLCLLNHDLHYRLEVFFRATNLLDQFLSVMKVRPKFLQCVTATCFYTAAKLEEKADVVQSLLSVLVDGYGCEFTQRDVQRMELIIMQKLDFKLTNYTAHDFLKIFHVLGVSQGSLSLPEGLSAEQHLCHTTLCLESIVCNHQLMKFKPSVLALAVLGCDLKLLGCDWLSAILSLQTFAQTKGGELSICYESVIPHYAQIASQYPLFVGIRKSAESPSSMEPASGAISEPVCVCDEQSSANLESTPTSPKAGSQLEPPLTVNKCSDDTVASIHSSPVKAAA